MTQSFWSFFFYCIKFPTTIPPACPSSKCLTSSFISQKKRNHKENLLPPNLLLYLYLIVISSSFHLAFKMSLSLGRVNPISLQQILLPTHHIHEVYNIVCVFSHLDLCWCLYPSNLSPLNLPHLLSLLWYFFSFFIQFLNACTSIHSF